MYTSNVKKDDIKIRNNSYCNMEEIYDDLYKKSQQGYNFYKLMEIISSIWDRIIQQAILQVMEPIAEAKFHLNSNGFRPLKSCETAMVNQRKKGNVE